MNIVRWLFPFAHGLGLGVLAMLLHECGHLLTAIVLGLRVKAVGMKWNRGLYSVRQQGTPLQNLLVAAAGPLTNTLLIPLASQIPLFGLANLCYALANILPIDGSDGSRVAGCWQHIRRARSNPRRV